MRAEGGGIGMKCSGRITLLEEVEDEEALKWAAIEKLPTYNRLRTSFMNTLSENELLGNNKLIDVRKLDINEKQLFIDRFLKDAEEDNEKFLRKFRGRLNRVVIELPTVQVRFEHLTVEADCFVGSRALPTLPNATLNAAESALGLFGIRFAKRTNLTILKDVSGIVKPSRFFIS